MHDEPIPTPASGEALVEVKSVGVCASDVHWYNEGRIGSVVLSDPLVLGHEASGVVAELGEGCSVLSPGDKVAIEPAKPCMSCEWCKSGHFNVCPGIPFFGTPPTDGCYREYVCWPEGLLLRMPDVLTYDETAMLEPMAVGLYAWQLAKMQRTESAAIIGAGAIGLSTLQAVRANGTGRIIVSEPIPERRHLARKLGADYVIDPNTADPTEAVHQLTDGRGADVVFECAGAENAIPQACGAARVLGRLVIVGIPDTDCYPFDAAVSRRKELTAAFVRRSNMTTEMSVELAVKKKIDLACYVTHRFPLEDAKQAMELMQSKQDGVIRPVISVHA